MSTRPRGVTLVELIVFIVLVGVALAGVFAAFDTIVRASADPQVRKQALAIAESLMEEVQQMPFTFCDPDDANAATATNSGTGAGGCTSSATSEDTAIGPESSPSAETRYSLTSRFDNVSDYNGFTMSSGIQDLTGNNIPGLDAYSASIAIAQAGTALTLTANEDALRISVTVSGPGSVSITLVGYRTRYSPNTLP